MRWLMLGQRRLAPVGALDKSGDEALWWTGGRPRRGRAADRTCSSTVPRSGGSRGLDARRRLRFRRAGSLHSGQPGQEARSPCCRLQSSIWRSASSLAMP